MANGDPKYAQVEVANVTLKRSSAKAGLYVLEDGTEHWLPFSQVADGSVDKDNTTGTLYIPRWLAEDREIDYDEV